MTIDTAGPAPVHPVPVTATKGSFERLAGVLFSPGETFADIARKPTVLVPLLLFIVLGYLSVIVMVPRMDWESVQAQQMQQMKKRNVNMTDADMERASKMTKAFSSVVMYVSPLLGVLWYVIVAVVLFGAVRLMGGEGTFKQALSATLYAWVPLVLFSIILTIVIAARGTIDPTQMATAFKSNPAFLVDMKEHPALFALLSSLDLFTIWTIVLLIFGFSALSKLSWAKTAAIVAGLWIVMVMVKIGFAALTAVQTSA